MFLETVQSTIKKYKMIRRGDRILIGVSGGPDSTALLTALVAIRQKLDISLIAAYVNHGLRPVAARHEIQFVRKLGVLLGVPTAILSAKVGKKAGQSLEAQARQRRYEVLARCAQKHRCSAIAVGHTQDDQAETVLMWILRGAGMTGLAGIPPVRKCEELNLIRPLIDCSRREVVGFLKSFSITPLKDRSNDSDHFMRNRIRRQLLPELEAHYNPKVKEHLAQLAGIVREEVQWLKAQVRRIFPKVARRAGSKIFIRRAQFRVLSAPLRKGILQEAVERLQGNCHGFALRHWEELDLLICKEGSRHIDLPHGFSGEGIDSRRFFISCRLGSDLLK